MQEFEGGRMNMVTKNDIFELLEGCGIKHNDKVTIHCSLRAVGEIENGADVSFVPKSVIITFDDGWLSNYTEIFEFMKEKNIKYNVYLEIEAIGNNPDYLTWDMVREMHKSGIVGFGAHTYSHASMKNIDEIDTEKEITLANEVKRILSSSFANSFISS